MQCLICVEFQIAGLLKDNEKIQSNPEVPPSEDDTEIKKIKKVRSDRLGAGLTVYSFLKEFDTYSSWDSF